MKIKGYYLSLTAIFKIITSLVNERLQAWLSDRIILSVFQSGWVYKSSLKTRSLCYLLLLLSFSLFIHRSIHLCLTRSTVNYFTQCFTQYTHYY